MQAHSFSHLVGAAQRQEVAVGKKERKKKERKPTVRWDKLSICKHTSDIG